MASSDPASVAARAAGVAGTAHAIAWCAAWIGAISFGVVCLGEDGEFRALAGVIGLYIILLSLPGLAFAVYVLTVGVRTALGRDPALLTRLSWINAGCSAVAFVVAATDDDPSSPWPAPLGASCALGIVVATLGLSGRRGPRPGG